MKIKGNIISTFCVLVILIMVLGKMDLYQYYPDYSYKLDAYSKTENKRDSLNSEINIAQQKLDNIKREKKNYIEGFKSFNGSYDNLLGLIQLEQKSNENIVNNGPTYLMLSKIGLKIQEIEGPHYLVFYTRNGISYLSKTKLSVNGKEHIVSYVDQKVNYKYSSEINSILLPLSSKFWRLAIEIFRYLIIALALFAYFFILKTFFQILIAISKNNVFEEKNIKRLKNMAILLLVLGVYPLVFNVIIYLIFSINHSTTGVVITHSFWEHDYFMVILSAICYLIYTAFKKAMILQQEQDLTI